MDKKLNETGSTEKTLKKIKAFYLLSQKVAPFLLDQELLSSHKDIKKVVELTRSGLHDLELTLPGLRECLEMIVEIGDKGCDERDKKKIQILHRQQVLFIWLMRRKAGDSDFFNKEGKAFSLSSDGMEKDIDGKLSDVGSDSLTYYGDAAKKALQALEKDKVES